MSLYDRGEPVRTAQFRDQTARDTAMANVRYIPALELCTDCRRYRTQATGRITKRGFVCWMCGGRK